MKLTINYETRALVISGTATIEGEYDGPSKPEAMVRQALADSDGNLGVTIMPVENVAVTPPIGIPDETIDQLWRVVDILAERRPWPHCDPELTDLVDTLVISRSH